MGDETMGKVWREYGYVCDPHTAAGWAAAKNYVNQTGDKRPMVVLSTASPYKFPEAVLTAIGETPAGDGFDQMEQLYAATGVAIPQNLASLRNKTERHTGVIEKTEMLPFVLGL
jgi:threonine synthase